MRTGNHLLSQVDGEEFSASEKSTFSVGLC